MHRSGAEIALSLGVVALGIGVAAVTATLPSEGGYAGIGPNFIPAVVAGGIILLISAILFVWNLAAVHRSTAWAAPRPLYALAVHPPQRVPAALNGFGLWNVLVLVLMLLAYGFPIAQFLIEPSPSAIVHRVR